MRDDGTWLETFATLGNTDTNKTERPTKPSSQPSMQPSRLTTLGAWSTTKHTHKHRKENDETEEHAY